MQQFSSVDRVSPVGQEMRLHLLDERTVVCRGVGVNDVEDAFARNDEAVAESLAFGRFECVFLVEPGGVLPFIVGLEVSDDVGLVCGGEDL